MSGHDSAPRFERPLLKRTAPRRSIANVYRSSGGGAAVGGVPLDSVEAAVVSAVRMGYKIAAAQIDRTERLAQRLRQAGDQAAGPGSDRQALDATEQLVFRAMMGGLSWLEGIATDGGNPLKRLAAAQYRILGSFLGLSPADKPPVRRGRRRDDSAEDHEASPPAPAGRAAAVAQRPTRARLKIRHETPEGRAVEVRRWHLAGAAAPGQDPITFYSNKPGAGTIGGALIVTLKGAPTLSLATPPAAAPGLWKAAICDEQSMQIGSVEIVL
jgi:hypothetical protein